jgi:hypothetical protein
MSFVQAVICDSHEELSDVPHGRQRIQLVSPMLRQCSTVHFSINSYRYTSMHWSSRSLLIINFSRSFYAFLLLYSCHAGMSGLMPISLILLHTNSTLESWSLCMYLFTAWKYGGQLAWGELILRAGEQKYIIVIYINLLLSACHCIKCMLQVRNIFPFNF